MSREQRLSNLGRNYLDKHDLGFLSEGQTKLGEEYDNIVVGPDLVESNQENPRNAGFKFTSSGARLRTGEKLTITSDYTKIFMGDGQWMFNPLSTYRASCVPDPIRSIIPTPPLGLDSFMFSEDVGKFLRLLSGVL
jgi:hypothetical protein